LFHGSFLLGLDLALVEQTLRQPSKQPAYRRNRAHKDFLTNLPLQASAVKQAMKEAWGATDTLEEIPEERIERLVREKYCTDSWSLKS
jgi:lipoate-protein ligase A